MVIFGDAILKAGYYNKMASNFFFKWIYYIEQMTFVEMNFWFSNTKTIVKGKIYLLKVCISIYFLPPKNLDYMN